jgi:hypothetical protein
MTAPKGCGFGLHVKRAYKESAAADVVLMDPSTSLGMTESRQEIHKHIDIALSFGGNAPLRGWCREETDDHSSLKRACVCQERNPSSASVIPSEVEESGRQL